MRNKWKDFLDDYKNYLILEKGLSKNTQLSYLRDLKKLKLFSEQHEELNPESIDKDFVQNFIYEFSKTNPAERSQSRMISSLKSFFIFLVDEDFRNDNPAQLLESPKIGFRLPDVISFEEVKEIIQAIDLTEAEGERNKTILEVLFGCGLRVSELVNLKISDLFFDEGFISVTGKGNKQRLVPLAKYTQNIIELYLQCFRNHQTPKPKSEDILFLNRRGGKLSREMIFIIIKKYVSKTKIKKNISPHTFRHSFATELLKNGADLFSIQQMLGHESITTTEIYAHLNKQQLRDTIEKYHPFNKK